MKTSQKAVYLLGGAALAVTAGLATQSVSAHFRGDSNLAGPLAAKLNLEESVVSTALDSVKDENKVARANERKTNYTEMLTAAVSAGKLTEAQKTLLLTKYDEHQVKRDEIRKQMENLRSETEAWAKTNNIDTQYLMMPGGMGGKGGPSGNGGMR
jgi:hypothetical protein